MRVTLDEFLEQSADSWLAGRDYDDVLDETLAALELDDNADRETMQAGLNQWVGEALSLMADPSAPGIIDQPLNYVLFGLTCAVVVDCATE